MKVRGRNVCGSCGAVWRGPAAANTPLGKPRTAVKCGAKTAKDAAAKTIGKSNTHTPARVGLGDITNRPLATPGSTPRGAKTFKKTPAASARSKARVSLNLDAAASAKDTSSTPRATAASNAVIATPGASSVVSEAPAIPVAHTGRVTRKACRVGHRLALLLVRGAATSSHAMQVHMHIPSCGQTDNFYFDQATLKDITNLPSAVRKLVMNHMAANAQAASSSAVSSGTPSRTLHQSASPPLPPPAAAAASTPAPVADAADAAGASEKDDAAVEPSSPVVSTTAGAGDDNEATASVDRDSVGGAYGGGVNDPKFSEAEVEIIKKQLRHEVTSELVDRHKNDTAFLLSEYERVQDMLDAMVVKNATAERRMVEYDAVLDEFEAMCTNVAADKDAIVSQVKQELAQTKIALTATQTTLVDSAQKASALTDEVSALKKQMSEQESATFASLEESAETLRGLREEIERYTEAEKAWKAEKAALEKQVSREKAKVQRVTEAAQSQLNAAKESYEKLQARDRQHGAEVKSVATAYKELQAKAAEFQTKGRAAAEENEKLVARIAVLDKTNAVRGAKLRDTECTIAAKNAEVKAAKDMADASAAEAEKTAAELEALKAKVEKDVADRTKELEDKCNAYKLQIFDLTESNSKLSERANACAGASAEEVAALKAELAKTTNERDAAQKKSVELEAISAELLAMMEGKA